VQERHERLPARVQDRDEGGRCDQERLPQCRAGSVVCVARCGPAQQVWAEHEPGLALEQDERAVGEFVELSFVVALLARAGIDALGVELRVDRVGADLAGVQLAPDRNEALVVLAAAERARTMAGCEGGRFIEEEQLGEAAWLQERPAGKSRSHHVSANEGRLEVAEWRRQRG